MPEEYTIETETDVNDEGSDFATVRIRFATGEVVEESFARWFDSGPIPSAREQAASFIAAFEESERSTLEERLAPFGPEWEREQEERGAWA